MPLKLERLLDKEIKTNPKYKHLSPERQDAIKYSVLRKTGWTPKREQSSEASFNKPGIQVDVQKKIEADAGKEAYIWHPKKEYNGYGEDDRDNSNKNKDSLEAWRTKNPNQTTTDLTGEEIVFAAEIEKKVLHEVMGVYFNVEK